MRLDTYAIAKALGGVARGSSVLAPGPGHGPRDRSLSILVDWRAPGGFVVTSFAGDDPLHCRDYVRERLGLEPWRASSSFKPNVAKLEPCTSRDKAIDNTERTRALWAARKPVVGTLAETYLSKARAYGAPIPETIGFLPPRGKYGATMISAFGIADEIEPGRLAISSSNVRGVHLTKLRADGLGKLDAPNNKITLGRNSTGFPIMLAPPNDGLGLAITEGIEDGLSIYEATGLGVWAAGNASRMPALAPIIPAYVEVVSIIGHDDAGGRRFATELAERLESRRMAVVLKFLRAPMAPAA